MAYQLLITSVAIAVTLAGTAIAAVERCETTASASLSSCQPARETLLLAMPRPVHLLDRGLERSGPRPPPVVVLSECL